MPETLFPPRYAVRLLKNVYIPMSDGTRIATDIFLPDAEERFPVIMEYLPYRKDDVMAYRQQRHSYFAERGFATAWVDIRGTGASGGIALDEYSRQEHDDACEIIAWLARQPWSNGNVGMTGISYGGFNSIQIAMRRPPALKAIIPAYATDDRYTDDVHFYGGALRALDQLEYPLFMIAMNALPPHAEIVGADWATLWEEHLKNEPWLLRWLEEQVDGDYWRYGSLRPQYETIEAATLLIGGWSVLSQLAIADVFPVALPQTRTDGTVGTPMAECGLSGAADRLSGGVCALVRLLARWRGYRRAR